MFLYLLSLELLVLEIHRLVKQSACGLGERPLGDKDPQYLSKEAQDRVSVCACRCCVDADDGRGDSLHVFRSVCSTLPPATMTPRHGRPAPSLTHGHHGFLGQDFHTLPGSGRCPLPQGSQGSA